MQTNESRMKGNSNMRIFIGWNKPAALFQCDIQMNDQNDIIFFTLTAQSMVNIILNLNGSKEILFDGTLERPDKAFFKTLLSGAIV